MSRAALALAAALALTGCGEPDWTAALSDACAEYDSASASAHAIRGALAPEDLARLDVLDGQAVGVCRRDYPATQATVLRVLGWVAQIETGVMP
ncbi:hypothetical protein LNKW23_17830 [Paralimibaculum aggregatum]|uniref:Lipoprotein n=1 Tax=Paralimibaculum aggregatum TaxID=3036245 RepID=A0ABQ6LQ39_9RHOB|nr:hypothetical protein [Limibaculum sp. NKW23]GMG82570.1 hypothetical protein LNKW23_17830 [Limibaculum sp. NKW23]